MFLSISQPKRIWTFQVSVHLFLVDTQFFHRVLNRRPEKRLDERLAVGKLRSDVHWSRYQLSDNNRLATRGT